MKNFMITNNTHAIISTYSGSKIITNDSYILSKESTNEILDTSCKYYGSSLKGRLEGARDILGIKYKIPVIISEKNNIIFFPTTSVRNESCDWINLNSIKSYCKLDKNRVEICFKNDCKIQVNITYGILDRQILRASRLANIIIDRKC